jgi:hypothetical protein
MTRLAGCLVAVFLMIVAGSKALGPSFREESAQSMPNGGYRSPYRPLKSSVAWQDLSVGRTSRDLSESADVLWFNKREGFPSELVTSVLSEYSETVGNLSVNSTAGPVSVYCSTSSPYLSIEPKSFAVSRSGS